jgi:DNA-binding MarR family transcriptional regulator
VTGEIGSIEHELDAPPWRRVEATLMATSRGIRRAYDARLAETGLNLSEASLLAYVKEYGASTQTQLAERLALGRAAVGSVIDALESKGLVTRRPDRTDRRVWLVSVTPEGSAVAVRVVAIDAQFRDDLRTGITREERRQLADMLLRLQENISSVLNPEVTV